MREIPPQYERPYRIDLTGHVYGRLTVTKFLRMDGNHSVWECRCECGNKREVRSNSLKNGSSASCGCLQREKARLSIEKNRITPFVKDQKFYSCWSSMIHRCTNKSNKQFKDYGGRGIKICDRWKSFKNFQDDMYESYVAHREIHGTFNTSIERKDVNGNYELKNCCWATRKEQAKNRQDTPYFELDGKRLHISEWAKALNITTNSIRCRLRYGWSLRDALTKGRSDGKGEQQWSM